MIFMGMHMDWQHVINVGAGGVLAVIGWFARQLWDAVKALQEDMKRLEISIADNYVKKADMTQMKSDINVRFDRVEHLLDKVYEKLENKADR